MQKKNLLMSNVIMTMGFKELLEPDEKDKKESGERTKERK